MTARTLRPEDYPTCSVVDCRMPAAFQMGFHFPEHPAGLPGQPLEVMVSLFCCEVHAEHPPQSPREFWGDEQRTHMTALMAAIGQPPLDYEGAAYHFAPLPPMSREVAN